MVPELSTKKNQDCANELSLQKVQQIFWSSLDVRRKNRTTLKHNMNQQKVTILWILLRWLIEKKVSAKAELATGDIEEYVKASANMKKSVKVVTKNKKNLFMSRIMDENE